MQNRRAFVTPGTRKQICNGHASKLELRHGSCSSLLMAGLASPTLNSFIQRHRAAAACVAALAFAAFAQDVKTKACGPKRPAAYRGFRGANKRVFPRKSCLGTEWPPAPRSGGVPGDAALSPPGGVGNGGDSLISARKGPRIACKTYVLRKICEFLTALDVGYFFFTHRLWGRGNARPGQTLGTATIEE